MDWNYLRTFHAVAETGSLTKAAEQLSISHATAFRHVRAFETALGSRVFEKVKGQYMLTEAGEEILGLAKSVAVSIGDIERQGKGRDVQLKGRVRLTAPGSFSYFFLPGYLSDFRRKYPDISVELLTSNDEINMSTRAAEIALRVTSTPPDHLIGRKIADIPWGIYGSPNYLQKHGQPQTIADLQKHQLIAATGPLARRPGFVYLDQECRDQIAIRCDDLMPMASFALQSEGLALLPADMCREGLTRCMAFSPAPDNQLWLLTHPDLRNIERVKQVMRFLSSAFKLETRLHPVDSGTN
ncbi:HTH-type transcriptional activator CmpR [Roseibium album]|nr:HTH-type transcriptional activator CmpR [Roseibium album]